MTVQPNKRMVKGILRPSLVQVHSYQTNLQ